MTRDVGMPEDDEVVEERHAKGTRDVREGDTSSGLFARDRAGELRDRWTEVQARFVDDPGAAVKEADALVEDVIGDLTTLFREERARLEAQIGERDGVDTEELRIALRRYRSFFERLLAL